MEEENETNDIVPAAHRLFSKYGFRGVTMDDIARDRGMSKKTLYQFFKDKGSLVEAVMGYVQEGETRFIKEITTTSNNPVEHFVRISTYFSQLLQELNPIAIYELKRYYPKVWAKNVAHIDEQWLALLIQILERGQEKGYFRSEIDTNIIARSRVLQVQNGCDPDLFPVREFNQQHVQEQFFIHFMYGICTAKGLALYHEIIQQDTN